MMPAKSNGTQAEIELQLNYDFQQRGPWPRPVCIWYTIAGQEDTIAGQEYTIDGPIRVRGFRTGYFITGRDGSGTFPALTSRRVRRAWKQNNKAPMWSGEHTVAVRC